MAPTDIAIALLVGFALGTVLGLLGGGGGILAIPAFVHVLGMGVDEASTTSLVVVAIGAAAGLIPHAIAGRVDWRIGLTFGALGTAGSVMGARLALVADDRLQLAGLIALIFLAASGMLRNADDSDLTRMRHRIRAEPQPSGPTAAAAAHGAQPAGVAAAPGAGPSVVGAAVDLGEPADGDGAPASPSQWLSLRTFGSPTAVGLVTRFFGVGGGFVAVPALMWGAGLPVRRATATGLVVIIINSLVAVVARGTDVIPWPVTGVLGAAAIGGAVVGAVLSRRVPAATLKRSFGWLLIVIGLHEVWQLALLY